MEEMDPEFLRTAKLRYNSGEKSRFSSLQPWEKRPRSGSAATYSVEVNNNTANSGDSDGQIEELKERLRSAKERISKAGKRRAVLHSKRRELSTLRDELNHRVNGLTLESREMTQNVKLLNTDNDSKTLKLEKYMKINALNDAFYIWYVNYARVVLLSCPLSSGALGSPDLLLLYYITTWSLHNIILLITTHLSTPTNDQHRYSGPYGTINNFRLGNLYVKPIEWIEINTALGQAAMALSVVACRLPRDKFIFTKYVTLMFRRLLLYTVGVVFHIYWCTRKPRSYSIILYNNSIIAQHHHTNNYTLNQLTY